MPAGVCIWGGGITLFWHQKKSSQVKSSQVNVIPLPSESFRLLVQRSSWLCLANLRCVCGLGLKKWWTILYLQWDLSNVWFWLHTVSVFRKQLLMYSSVAIRLFPPTHPPPIPNMQASTNIVRKSRRKQLSNSVSNDLLPFMVGQSHDSFTLLSVKNGMLFQQCQQAIQVLCIGCRQQVFWSKRGCQVTCFSVHFTAFVSDMLQRAEILDCCHSQQCRSLVTLSSQ
jgi:hypothetical protein